MEKFITKDTPLTYWDTLDKRNWDILKVGDIFFKLSDRIYKTCDRGSNFHAAKCYLLRENKVVYIHVLIARKNDDNCFGEVHAERI